MFTTVEDAREYAYLQKQLLEALVLFVLQTMRIFVFAPSVLEDLSSTPCASAVDIFDVEMVLAV